MAVVTKQNEVFTVAHFAAKDIVTSDDINLSERKTVAAYCKNIN